jgi:hypothetical protein
VYLIFCRASNLVKIGFSNKVGKRLAAIKAHSPTNLELVGIISSNNCTQLEMLLHRRLNHFNVHGEWFKVTKDVLMFVDIVEKENHASLYKFLDNKVENLNIISTKIRTVRDRTLEKIPKPKKKRKPLKQSKKSLFGHIRSYSTLKERGV